MAAPGVSEGEEVDVVRVVVPVLRVEEPVAVPVLVLEPVVGVGEDCGGGTSVKLDDVE